MSEYLKPDFEEFFDHLEDLNRKHNPITCSLPAHIKIRDIHGHFHCGPGGYRPTDGKGYVFILQGRRTIGRIEGDFISANTPLENTVK
ncbi:hypothetical protein HY408_00515 [Candidatus Gottesmanbacteria bacterium]|nr:hypothetical protein [Candidatus Gottesmanbacteria bacterium]